MTRLRLALHSAHLAALNAAGRIAARAGASTRTVRQLDHAYARQLARRNALRDHVASTDPRGCLGDEVLGLLLLIGVGLFAPDLIQDAQRTYAEHLATTYTQVATQAP